MDIKVINDVLRRQAVGAGLCKDWQENKWNRVLSKDELMSLYLKGIDFSLKKEWFDYDFIRKAFTQEELRNRNIYLDEEIVIPDASSGQYVFLGKCRVDITFNGFQAAVIYCRHDSEVNVKAYEGARIFVRYYDASRGSCKSDDWSVIKTFNRRKK